MATRSTTRKPAARKPAAKKAPAKTTRKPAAKKPAAKKPAARKPAARKPAARKAPARKPAAAKAAAPAMKTTAIKDKMTKTQMLQEIADATGISRAEASKAIDALGSLIGRHLNKRGIGEFTMPGLFKIVTIKKPAQKARKGINPFTKEPTVFKAKPARTMVKVRPLKKLKEMAE